MFCFNHTSTFYTSNSVEKMLINNKFEAQTVTRNPTGNSRCHALASRALNMSCGFGQSARSIHAWATIWWSYVSETTLKNIDKYAIWIHGHWYCSTNRTKPWWRHQILRYWPFVRGIHRFPVNSPHKGQWRRALMFSLICAWINGRVNNGEAGDLRRYRAHYDVSVRHNKTGSISYAYSDDSSEDIRNRNILDCYPVKHYGED